MIREFYVFERTGRPVFHRSYSESRIDEALLSGFLAAVFSFAREIGHGGIQTMVMKDTVFVYEVSGEFIFAVAVDVDDDELAARSFLSHAISLFFKISESKKIESNIIDEFGSVLGSLIDEYNSRLMVKDAFCAPFLILDGEGKSEEELAVVFLLLEKMRGQKLGLLRRREIKVNSVVKILWPFWIVPSDDGNCIMVDGLFRDHVVVKCFLPPELSDEELETELLKDPLKSIDVIARILRERGGYKTFAIPSLVWHEQAQELATFLSRARMSRVKDAVILSSALSKDEVEEVGRKFLEVFRAVKDGAEKLKRLSEKVVAMAEGHLKDFEERRLKIEKEYSEKIEKLKEEIENEKRKAEEEKKQKAREIGMWACQVVEGEFNKFKELASSFSSNLMVFIETVSSSINMGSLDLLEKITPRLEEMKVKVKDLNEAMKQFERTVRSTLSEAQSKCLDVERQFEKTISEIEKKMDMTRKEMDAQILSLNKTREKYRKKLKKIYNYLEEHLRAHEEDIAALTGSTIKGFNVNQICIVYLSVYLAEIGETGWTEIALVPPLNLAGGASILDEALNSLIAKFLMERFAHCLKNREFTEYFRRILSDRNILLQKELEPKIYDGLNNLLEKGYLTAKDFSMVKMGVIDLFREKSRA